jgi:hypothetical protein
MDWPPFMKPEARQRRRGDTFRLDLLPFKAPLLSAVLPF